MISTLYVPAQAAQGLDLAQLLQSRIYTDVTLQVLDLASGVPCFSLEMHRVILHAASLHFRRMLVFNGQPQSVIRVHLDMQLYSSELVRLFFSLFYVTVFDTAHLRPEVAQAIGENVLFLYQLASLYLFDSLRAHCETLLFASFSLDHFKLLSDYTLVQSTVTPSKLSVLDERVVLYARYLQWYQCCVENDNNKKYTELQLSPRSAGATANESGEAQQQQQPQLTIDRHYFSCNKAEIMDELRLSVDNIAQCQIPEHSVRSEPGGVRQLQYYRKICPDCLRRGAVTSNHTQYSNIGCIRKNYANGHESYSFRLSKTRHPARHCTLEMCMERVYYNAHAKRRRRDSRGHHQGDEEEEEEEMVLDGLEYLDSCDETGEDDEQRHSVQCEVTLLSKRLVLSRFTETHTEQRLNTMAQVCALELDERQDCYSGRCQSCHHNAPLYILLLRLSVQRQKTDSAMSIET